MKMILFLLHVGLLCTMANSRSFEGDFDEVNAPALLRRKSDEPSADEVETLFTYASDHANDRRTFGKDGSGPFHDGNARRTDGGDVRRRKRGRGRSNSGSESRGFAGGYEHGSNKDRYRALAALRGAKRVDNGGYFGGGFAAPIFGAGLSRPGSNARAASFLGNALRYRSDLPDMVDHVLLNERAADPRRSSRMKKVGGRKKMPKGKKKARSLESPAVKN